MSASRFSMLFLCFLVFAQTRVHADGVPLPGGVADVEGKVGYLAQPKGGVVAVRLDKGEVLWESTDANRPLALVGKRLAALAPEKGKNHVLRVLLLDAEKGKKLLTTEPIGLPVWSMVGLGLDRNEMGKGFTARTSVAKGKLELRWWASSRYWGGAAPSPEVIEATTKDAHGVVLIDPDSGKHEAKIEAKAGGPTPTGLMDVAKLPKIVQEVAGREGWTAAAIVGPRAFGRVERSGESKKGGPIFGGTRVVLIQALDLKTSALLWERAFEEHRILPPPP